MQRPLLAGGECPTAPQDCSRMVKSRAPGFPRSRKERGEALSILRVEALSVFRVEAWADAQDPKEERRDPTQGMGTLLGTEV